MSISAGLTAGRQWLRDVLASITIANGYSVEMKSTDGGQNENPLKMPSSLLPRGFVYSDSCKRIVGQRLGEARVSAPAMVDIWFQMGKRKGNGEEYEEFIDAFAMALVALADTRPAGVKIVFADDPMTYGLSAAGGAILRMPMTIEATYSLR